jgi:hypothetical protein
MSWQCLVPGLLTAVPEEIVEPAAVVRVQAFVRSIDKTYLVKSSSNSCGLPAIS